MKLRGKRKDEYEQLEAKYDALLVDKMELEYKCKTLENDYIHEKEQGDEILKLHEKARRLKHDMKNHVMVIAAFLQENQAEEARDYLSGILDQLNSMYTYIETGNTLMSHILNVKLEEAHNKGIHVKAKIENLSFKVMDSVDFTSVFTNLLDNALEGVNGTEPLIYVEVSKKRGYETILIKNSINESVLVSNPDLKSTKEKNEMHGYGTVQIKLLTDKYDGLYDFYEEDGMFCACIMIPYE